MEAVGAIFSSSCFASVAVATAPVDLDRVALVRLAQDLFPHPMLPMAKYQGIVDTILSPDAWATSTAPYSVASGEFTSPGAGAWLRLSEKARRPAIVRLLRTPFGRTFRQRVMFALYDDPQVTMLFGYPGPSIVFGGYIDHGFDDLNWLPDPDTTLVAK